MTMPAISQDTLTMAAQARQITPNITLDPSGPGLKGASDDAELREACQDFEAIFIQSMLKTMRKAVPESNLIERSNAEKMFQDMLDQEMAVNISRKQSVGIADQIYRQMEQYVQK